MQDTSTVLKKMVKNPLAILVFFPSDQDLRKDLTITEQQATHLVRLCGVDIPTDAIDD